VSITWGPIQGQRLDEQRNVRSSNLCQHGNLWIPVRPTILSLRGRNNSADILPDLSRISRFRQFDFGELLEVGPSRLEGVIAKVSLRKGPPLGLICGQLPQVIGNALQCDTNPT